MPVTRGFFRKRPESPAGRLPPGQYDTGSSWPVLTAEATPPDPPQLVVHLGRRAGRPALDVDLGGDPTTAALDLHR
jgi:hypothetical protein